MRKVLVSIFLSIVISQPAIAAPDDHLEQLLDVLVTANFNDDMAAAGQALTALVEYERASGIEPSGRLAVIQIRETQAFSGKLEARLKGYLDNGLPILASIELSRFEDVLRFEPSGAAKYRAMSEDVDRGGAALCQSLMAEAATRPGIKGMAEGVCAGFGQLVSDKPSSERLHSNAGLVPPPVGVLTVEGDTKGFVDSITLSRALERTIGSGSLVGRDGTLSLSIVLSGTSVSSVSGGPGQLPFQYAIEVPYAEMEEYCQWVEEVKLETVVEGAITKTVKRTTRKCNKSQRPVDKVRVEPRTLMLDGMAFKQTVIWQYRVAFDDGEGCSGAETFDGRDVFTDFEHNLSDPAIGLAPDPKTTKDPGAVAIDIAGRIGGWVVEAESSCLRKKWCGPDSQAGDLETTLRCAALPGGDPRAVDAVVGTRFGVSVDELEKFMGRDR